ncbi:hypothetical protein EJ03DRAFT_340932 [Teratosphaeria nubilosa]|uniref:Mannosyltransferase n=1 Tax=Teratosphaeria nubilosa TaxID=161662 RepID=A0A6G1LKV7_9PEZI|nr:hypothetical protein EJ03DRAFT_340932 [Teratosphaeria nubilosa]
MAPKQVVRQRFKPPAPNDPPSPPRSPPSRAPGKQVIPTAPFLLDPRIAFYVLFTSHALAALFHPIQDCDEVFNYWEPTHYLTHGHGFQTWEYSPEYAIRSWTYVVLHAIITLPAKLLGGGKVLEFYTLRILLAFICALCETRLYSKVAVTLNPRVAVTLVGILCTSSGLWHASIAYLPSSFAMYFTALGIAAFLDWCGGLRTAQGIWMFGLAATLGWPFAAALSIPFLFEEAMLGLLNDSAGKQALFWCVVDGVVRTLCFLAAQIGLDAFFYKKLQVVPLNIVMYNVLSASKGKGPDIYGTEPWHFYLRNLFLNFHVWLPLALLALPLLLAQNYLSMKSGAMKTTRFRGIIFTLPFYLWLGIFTLQPHKEERFMYPAYPALALNAAVSMHIILANIGSTDPKDMVAKIPVQIRLFAVLVFLFGGMAVSLFRTLGTITAFGAPLAIYQPLHQPGVSKLGDTVCLGKEWYRFPSHYLLPEGVRAKFMKSEFEGLLPGEFSEAAKGFGLFPGTWLVPPGMNDENREDPGKYTDVRHCSFIVDRQLPSTEVTSLEPSYINDQDNWEKLQCLPFMDAASTGTIGRLGWVPDLPFIPERFRRVWGEYCLLRRKKKQTPEKRMDGIPGIEHLS